MKSIKKNTREDGAETKAQLIQCAGRLIADQGYDRTTSKDICRLAGVNMAAVNYHFGSREGLYQAVLDEVYHYVLSPVEIETIYHMDIGPREKLMKLLDLYVKEALFSESWQVKVSIRELINPSDVFTRFVESYIGRKLTPVLDILSDYLGLPARDDRVPRAFLAALSPFLISSFPAIARWALLCTAFPKGTEKKNGRSGPVERIRLRRPGSAEGEMEREGEVRF